MGGHGPAATGPDVGDRRADGRGDAVGFRRGGQVHHGLCEVELRLREADLLHGRRGGGGDGERAGSAIPTSSLAKITIRRAMNRASSPATSIRASQCRAASGSDPRMLLMNALVTS